jgi:hypothetical protein
MPFRYSKGNEMSRFRLTAYVSYSVADRLAIASKRKGFNRSKLVDRALDKFLAGDGSQGNDASLQRRLDNMSKHQERTERNIAVLLETLGLFVRYYLTVTPPLPKSEQDPARSLGNQRFEVFVSQIGKRLAAGQSTVRDVMERIAADDPDLFARDLDEQSPDGFVIHKNSSAKPTSQTSQPTSSGPAGPRRGGEAPVQRGQGFASRPPDVAPGASSPTIGDDNG